MPKDWLFFRDESPEAQLSTWAGPLPEGSVTFNGKNLPATNFKINIGSEAPTSPPMGVLWFDSQEGNVKVTTDTSTIVLPSGNTGTFKFIGNVT